MNSSDLPSVLLFGIGSAGRNIAGAIAEVADPRDVLCLSLKMRPDLGREGVLESSVLGAPPIHEGMRFVYTEAGQLFHALGYDRTQPKSIVLVLRLGEGLHSHLLADLTMEAVQKEIPIYLMPVLPPRFEDTLLEQKVREHLIGWNRLATGILTLDLNEVAYVFGNYQAQPSAPMTLEIAQNGFLRLQRQLQRTGYQKFAFLTPDNYYDAPPDRSVKTWQVSLVRIFA